MTDETAPKNEGISLSSLAGLLGSVKVSPATPIPVVQMADIEDPGIEAEALARPIAIVHKDYNLHDLSQYLANPGRIETTVHIATPESFMAYWDRYCNEEESVLFSSGNEDDRILAAAVFDYHRVDGTARPGKHVALLAPRMDPDFIEIRKESSAYMGHAELAEWLEEYLPAIAEPEGAYLMEAVLNMRAHRDVKFASKVSMRSNDAAFTYEENTTASSGVYELEIPKEIVFSVPVYEGGEPVRLKAALRYKLNGTTLTLCFKIPRIEGIVRNARKELLAPIIEAVHQDRRFVVPDMGSAVKGL